MASDSTKLTIELEVLLRSLNRTLRGLDQVKRKLESVANVRVGTRNPAAAVERQTLAAQRLALQQQRVSLIQQRLSIQTQELANRQERARQAADRLTRSSQRLQQSLSNQSRILPVVQQRMNSLGAAALRVGGGLRSVGASAAILVSGPLAALGTLAARSAADIDAIRNRLIATEGSLEAANARLAQLRRLADDSIGVTRRGAVDTFAILTTLGEVTEDTINKQIKAFGRLNAAFTIEDQQLFFRNLLQIFQQGFEIRDIKEALGRVPIFNQLLQQAFGTSDPDRLRELKAAGKLTLDTFLSGLATAVETDPILSDIGESISVRFQKTFERLSDALEPLGRAILGPLERIVLRLEPIILRISAAFSSLSPGIQTAIVAVGLLTVALGPILFIFGGIASGIGAFATALAAVIPILASIGLPAIAAILSGLIIVIGEITAVVVALGLAWRTNFLGIQQIASNTARAVVAAFNRIRAVFGEFFQRVLPTLQSLTNKVLGAVIEVWERYGATVTKIVGDVFNFVIDTTETFLRAFTDFADLVLKLIDGDWRGAWRAFSRIVVAGIDKVGPLLARFGRAVRQALLSITAFVVRQAVAFANAGAGLASRLITSLAIGLITGAPQISNALALMLLTAASGVVLGPIAQVLVARLLAEMRKAAAEGLPEITVAPRPGETSVPRRRKDVAGAGIFRPKRDGGGDEKSENVLRKQLDRLREAQDKLAEAQEEAQLAQLRSRIETEFEATKAGLDRELSALEANFDDRLVALRKYLSDRKSLEESQIDAEIAKELELTSVLFQELSSRRRAAEREFRTELTEISRDPKLKGQARDAAIQTAELKKATELERALSEFKIKHGEATARVVELEKQRKAITDEMLRLERRLTEEIQRQQAALQFDLFEEQGRIADAEAGRLSARFTETIRDLRVDVASLSPDLQRAINNVDLTTLRQQFERLPEPVQILIELLDIGIAKARIAERALDIDRSIAELRLQETDIQNKVLDGVLLERDARAQIAGLQQIAKGRLLDILAAQLAIAKATKGQEDEVLRIQAQIKEIERLGIVIDEFGQRINQTLFADLQSGLSGIFSGARRGFEGLRDAAISFGERLLDTLNDIAATSIIQRLEGLFKPDADNTEGTVGGFLSKLFGLAPKQTEAAAASAALQAGAVAASTTLTTGAATAGTSFGASVVTAAASFASAVISAGAAFAASVAASGASEAIGGLGAAAGSALGGAATGLFPAVPGGVYKFVEGGYPEAVMTTDPKHAARQYQILKAFLRETRGLGGRIKGFAAGAMITPEQIQSNLLSGFTAPPMPTSDIGNLPVITSESSMRLRQILVDQRDLGNWVNSSEGERVLIEFLNKNQPTVRKLSGR